MCCRPNPQAHRIDRGFAQTCRQRGVAALDPGDRERVLVADKVVRALLAVMRQIAVREVSPGSSSGDRSDVRTP